MPGFFDATCPHCKRRYGWAGELKDRPINCPKCGKKLPEIKEDDPDEKEFADFIKMLNEKKKKQ